MPASKAQVLEKWVQGELQPDVTLLFDVPVEISIQRLAGARSPDKFEQENADFFGRIRSAYLARAQENKDRFRIIDASRSIQEIQNSLEETVLTI